MSVSFKFDDLNFTTHLSASDIKGRERVFLALERNLNESNLSPPTPAADS